MATRIHFLRIQTQQAQGVEQLNKAVAEMDKVTRQNAANAEETASASEVLKSQADEMRYVLKQLMAIVDAKNGRAESAGQARRAAIRQAQHIQAYVSSGENRATLNGVLRRSFSTACQVG